MKPIIPDQERAVWTRDQLMRSLKLTARILRTLALFVQMFFFRSKLDSVIHQRLAPSSTTLLRPSAMATMCRATASMIFLFSSA